jgi:uncharacterized protein (TIGR03437 family)
MQVLINGIAAPLLSVQQGLITFLTPENKPPVPAAIDVLRNGSVIVSPPTMGADVSDFGIFSRDGSGFGTALAIDEGGISNGPINQGPFFPAQPSMTVSIFGTGAISVDTPVYVGTARVQVDSIGPAPGQAPGVKQVTLRLGPRPFNYSCAPVTIGAPFAYPTPCIYVGL